MRYTLIFLLVCIFGLGQEQYQFPKIKSNISLPVSVPIAEINQLINQSVKGILYEDQSFTDNNNDQFKVKVEKEGNISIKGLTNNRLMISVPLKVWAEKGYGAFGAYAYKDTRFNVVMNFITSISANTAWKLDTKTTTAGFVWKEKPVLVFGSVKVPIANFVESTLNEQQSSFTKIIDKEISSKFDMKPYLIMAYNQFSKPINISEAYNTWLKISPQNTYLAPVQVFADKIKTTVGIDLYSETFVGRIPLATPNVNSVPNFIQKTDIPNVFNLQTTAHIGFDEATRLAKVQFLNKEFSFREGKTKIKISDISVYSEGSNIVLEAKTEGSINGIFFVKGLPVYDEVHKKIALTQTDFKLKTSNILYKAVAVLFEGKIRKMIESDYGIPLTDIENASRKSLNESFNKEYYKGIRLQGNVVDLRPSQFLLSPQYITVVIDTKAKLNMIVSGLSL